MGKRAQKRGGKAPRPPTPSPPPPEPTSSDEELEALDHRALVERCKALEKEAKEREAGRGDGGSGSSAAPAPRVFTRKGRGALMFTARPSRSGSRRLQAQESPQVPSVSSAPSSSLDGVAAGETGEGDDDVEVAGCWGDPYGYAPPPAKQAAPSVPWWGPGWGSPYFSWPNYGMAPPEAAWCGWGCPRPPRRSINDLDRCRVGLPYGPTWEEVHRLARHADYEDGPEDRPYGSIDLPLGGHLAMSVKEKIWRGDYVDLFSLLQVEPERVPKVGEPERDLEASRRRKIDHNWTNWLYGYCIYMAVVVQLRPKRAPAMIKYLDIVHRTLRDFGGNAWLQYDQNFRMRAANDPSLDWSVPKFELWMQVAATAKPVQGDRSDSGHLIARNAAQPKASSGASGVQGQRLCYEFGSTGACTRGGCPFSHLCSVCRGKHSALHCLKGKGFGGSGGRGGKKGGGSQPPPPPPAAGKGAVAD